MMDVRDSRQELLKGLDDLWLELENDLSKLIADYEEVKKRHDQCSKNYLDLDTKEIMALDEGTLYRLSFEYNNAKSDLLLAANSVVDFVVAHRNHMKFGIFRPPVENTEDFFKKEAGGDRDAGYPFKEIGGNRDTGNP